MLREGGQVRRAGKGLGHIGVASGLVPHHLQAGVHPVASLYRDKRPVERFALDVVLRVGLAPGPLAAVGQLQLEVYRGVRKLQPVYPVRVGAGLPGEEEYVRQSCACLLYTSDAADE